MPQWLTRFLDSPLPALLDALSNIWWALGVLIAILGAGWRQVRRCRKDAIESWCVMLGHTDNAKRQEATKKLISCGSRSVDHLVDVLYQTDSDTQREQIVRILCKIGFPALRALLMTRREEDITPFVDGALEKQLPRVVERNEREKELSSKWKNLQKRLKHNTKKEIVNRLIELLDDNDSIVQEGAAIALGYYPRAEIVRELGRSLYPTECQNPQVRKAIVESLGQLKISEATKYLKIALRDPDRDVQFAACQAVANIEAEDVIWTLQYLLIPYEHPEIRIEAARTLGKIGGRKALDVLARAQSYFEDDTSSNQTLQDVIANELASVQSTIHSEEYI